MAVFDTFSKRQKRVRGEAPDVYNYDTLPSALRVQILHALYDITGRDHYAGYNQVTGGYTMHMHMVHILRRELGVFDLPPRKSWEDEDFIGELGNYFLTETRVSHALDALEVIFRGIERIGPDVAEQEVVDNAIAEINQRLKEHGVGYEYEGELIRIDSELLHAEAVRPALVLLRDPAYSGADQEFRSAFEHYRVGNTKEALNDALKAIESTLKVIFTKRAWNFNPTDPAKKLLDVAFANGLIPHYWTSHFTSLRAMLESSVPTARNKSSGHGQGVGIQNVPDHLASYVMHMTASTVVFLVKAEQAMP